MLYKITKYWVRAGLLFFFSEIRFNDRKVLCASGPLMIACNHPNSFLDAIVIGSHFKRPVHFLARGDAFRRPAVKKILEALKLIPIYRLIEGREHLALNDATFATCKDIFSKGGIVLIFPEGLCENQWTLRPLKKGATRIALHSWADDSPGKKLIVHPAGINYNVFGMIGRRVFIHFGKPLLNSLVAKLPDPEAARLFNTQLSKNLEECMLLNKADVNTIQFLLSNLSTGNTDKAGIITLQSKQATAMQNGMNLGLDLITLPALFTRNNSSVLRNVLGLLILALPAAAGYVLHAILYLPVKKYVRRKTAGTVFYDSVLFGVLLLSYPVYWLLINSAVWILSSNVYVPACFILMPLFAWLYLRWRDCWQSIKNTAIVRAPQRRRIRDWMNQ